MVEVVISWVGEHEHEQVRMNMKEYFLVHPIHINGIFLNIILMWKYSLMLRIQFHGISYPHQWNIF